VTTNFGGVDVVPLLGAIAGCRYGGGESLLGAVDVLPLLGAIAGCHCIVVCHCSVLVEGKVTANFWEGAIVVCYGWGAG